MSSFIPRFLVINALICVSTALLGLLIKTYYDSTSFSDTFKAFEVLSHQKISVWFYLLSIGPQIIFWPFALFYLKNKSNSLGFFFICFAAISALLFFSELDLSLGTHNARFISPVNYIGYGILTILGIQYLSSKLSKYKLTAFYILSLTLLIFSLPPMLSHGYQMVHDRNIFSPISYLPNQTLEGFDFLKKMPDGAVLTTPSEFIGQLLPAFTNKKVFIGRHIATPDYEKKAQISDSFFRGDISYEQALAFVNDHKIRYVVLTSVEKYVTEPFLTYEFLKNKYQTYSFLKEIYKNNGIVIFEIKHN